MRLSQKGSKMKKADELIAILSLVRVTSVLVAALIISQIILFGGCSTWTQQDTETAVDVAQDVLSVVAQVLDRADQALKTCDEMEDSESELFLDMILGSCTDIIDAKEHLERLRDNYGTDKGLVTENNLRKAANELNDVLSESSLVR